MPGGVASIRRLSATASIIRSLYVRTRYTTDRLLAGHRLFERGTRVLQPGIDFLLGLNVTLLPRAARDEGTLAFSSIAAACGSPHVESRVVGLASSSIRSSVTIGTRSILPILITGMSPR